jgi:hypothetical protein
MHLLDASPADRPSIQERPPKRRVRKRIGHCWWLMVALGIAWMRMVEAIER